ncbi:predicted protein [Thalassiosira pseudonana CCMP1335]|uniref:THO complex subunit 1 n=1 Tax=Thalassiosira pseudonana TaxID=35128 RepID=B8CBS0_THAPS|nr:predicted protein [Thalassiosira pseudonana CCMP1335]EED89365.1 predicted protein [Thalassiosira pseudonana CCMP1335]
MKEVDTLASTSEHNNNNDDDDRLDTTDPNFISSLVEPLKGLALVAFPPDVHDGDSASAAVNGNVANVDDGKDVSAAAVERLNQFEISIRSHLFELIEPLVSDVDNNGNASADDDEDVHPALKELLRYLKDATLLCLHVAQLSSTANVTPKSYKMTGTSVHLKKLPTILLQDTTTSLPLSTTQILWSAIPHLSPFHPTTGYSSTALCHPLLFTPGSSLNLLRICNHLLKLSSSSIGKDAEFAGSVMVTLARVFPLSERSALNVLGSFNVGSVVGFEGEEERNHHHHSLIGYDFYKTFWGVQKVFTDPSSTILASRGGLKQSEALQAYDGFVADVKTILGALESTPVAAPPSESTSNSSVVVVVNHHKYLTSPQLLHLQLKDSTFRIHFLTQLIIIINYLTSTPTSVTLPTPPITPTPGADTTKLQAQIKQTQLKQLNDLNKRVEQLLRSSSSAGAATAAAVQPYGENQWKGLTWLLRDRETMWKAWKRGKCKSNMDSVLNDLGGVRGGDVRAILGSSGRKRTLEEVASSGTATGGSGDVADNAVIGIKTNLPTISSQMAQSQPSLTDFLDPYIEALDPESGIEAEYHPRNDKVYSWRALRLLARNQEGEGQLRRFGKLRRKDGDFEGVVRDMWKEEKGEEIPGQDNFIEDTFEELEFENAAMEEKEGGGGDLGDTEMDDVSVGTPEDDVEAKLEKMSAFAAAAMEVEEDMLNKSQDVGEESTGEGDVKKEGGDEGSKEVATKAKEGASNGESAPATVRKEDEPESDTKKANGNKEKETSKDSAPASSVKSVAVKEETKAESTKKPTATTPRSNGGKDDALKSASKNVSASKSGDTQAQSRAKFTPPQRRGQQQQDNNTSQSKQGEKQQDSPKDKQDNSRGSHRRDNKQDSGAGRAGGHDRRSSDNRHGPPPQMQPGRGGRGNRESSHSPKDRGDSRGNGPTPNQGGRGWEPPNQGGRGGRGPPQQQHQQRGGRGRGGGGGRGRR